MTDRYEALRKAAEEATPGPWIVEKDLNSDIEKYGVYSEDDDVVVSHFSAIESKADADYIASANPDAILALLAERDAWKARFEGMEEERERECQRKTDALLALQAVNAKCDALAAEVEALKVDAERYRWIRGPSRPSTRYSRWRIEYWAGRDGWQPVQREGMDSAIDAAREEQS